MHRLFRKYLDNQCSPEDVKELLSYFKDPGNEHQLKGIISDMLKKNDVDNDDSQWQQTTDEIFVLIKTKLRDEHGQIPPFFMKNWFRVSVSVILIPHSFLYPIG